MADDIVVLTDAVAEGGKDPFAKDGEDQVGSKEDGRHLDDCWLPYSLYFDVFIIVVVKGHDKGGWRLPCSSLTRGAQGEAAWKTFLKIEE